MSNMSAAQAAQQKNRDNGGRYSTQERGEAAGVSLGDDVNTYAQAREAAIAYRDALTDLEYELLHETVPAWNEFIDQAQERTGYKAILHGEYRVPQRVKFALSENCDVSVSLNDAGAEFESIEWDWSEATLHTEKIDWDFIDPSTRAAAKRRVLKKFRDAVKARDKR